MQQPHWRAGTQGLSLDARNHFWRVGTSGVFCDWLRKSKRTYDSETE